MSYPICHEEIIEDRDVTAQLDPRGDVAVLVPAAGAGVRLGPGRPKALRLLGGEPLLVHAVRRLAAAASVHTVVVAAPAADLVAVRELLAPVAPVTVVAGGVQRQASVAAALTAHAAATDPLTDDAGLVEKLGVPVVCVPGSEHALKITRPFDLALAEHLLAMGR